MLYHMLRLVGAIDKAPKAAPKHKAVPHKHEWDNGVITGTGWTLYTCPCGATDI